MLSDQYHEVRVFYPKKPGEVELENNLTVVFDDGVAKGFRTLMDYGHVQTGVPETGESETSERHTTMVSYIGTAYPPGTVIIATPEGSRRLEAILEDRQLANPWLPTNNHGPLQRMAMAEGVQDHKSAGLLRRYQKSLEDEDYDALVECLHPEVDFRNEGVSGVVDAYFGREEAAQKLLVVWGHFNEQFNHPKHVNQAQMISTHHAYIRYEIPGIDVVFSTEYGIEDYKIKSVRHLRESTPLIFDANKDANFDRINR